MPPTDHIIIPADRTAKIVLPSGDYFILWLDGTRNEVIVQGSAKGSMVVRPRAGNSIALSTERAA
jgi:hypothetical protein